ncbi:MAG: aldo/keto reductase [Bryobacteraceae bacterium]
MPPVCRLGLATRGNSRLGPADVEHAVERGINYLNWCGRPDALSQTVAALGRDRAKVVVAAQLDGRDFDSLLRDLGAEYLDIATLYYVESEAEWREILAPGGLLDSLQREKAAGRLRLIGLTSHQRRLAASWLDSGHLDLLMVRYNAAHRGAERDVFPVAASRGTPVVTFTATRWGALRVPDCYRFCLANPAVSVTLAAPATRRELDDTLGLLDDWRAPDLAALRAHGDRVRRVAGRFP